MDDIRTFFENLYRVFMYKDELISLHQTIQALTHQIHKQHRVIRRLRENNVLSTRQIKYIRRTFRVFLLLRVAPFYRNGHWIGIMKSDVTWLNGNISPIINLFKLCDWRRSSMILHDIQYHTNMAFTQAIRSRLLFQKMQLLQKKVHRLRMNGAFKRGLDISLPYLGTTYRIKWSESDIRFDDMLNMDLAAFAVPIRRMHQHVAFLYATCTEFCLLCGVTDNVVHHALCESVLNAIPVHRPPAEQADA